MTVRSARGGGPRSRAAILTGLLAALLAGCGGDAVVAQPADGAPPAAPAPTTAPTAPPAPTESDATATAAPSCEVADRSGPARTWQRSRKTQQAFGRAQDALYERFEQSSKENPDAELEAGLIGLAFDDPAREHVVVVDPALIDVAELDAYLKSAARAVHERDPRLPEIAIRAHVGCYPAEDIIEALAVVSQVATAKDESGVFSWYPRAHDGRIEVNADATGELELRRRLGDRVAFDE